MKKILENKISIIRSVLFTSLPAFFVAEIFFAIGYYCIIGIANFIYYIFSLFSSGSLETNMQIFSFGNIFVFLLTIIAVSFLTTLEISTIIAITVYDWYRNDHIPLKNLFAFAFERIRGLWKWRMLPFFLLVFLFPKEHIGPRGIFSLNIPQFIIDELYKTPIYAIIITILVFLAIFVIYRGIFIFHYILLSRTTFFQAYKLSNNLVKKIKKRDKFFIFLQNFLWNLIFTLPIIAIGVVISRRISSMNSFLGFDIETISTFISWILNFLFVGIPGILFLASLTIAFIKFSGFDRKYFEKRLHFISDEKPITPRWKNVRTAFAKKYPVFIVTVSMVLAPLYLSVIIDTKSRIQDDITIISHRGVSVNNFMENSISGIIEAAKQGANIVEIDVYENADGTIILSHDSNIRRVTGINKNIFELTNQDLEQIKLKNNEKIPTLAEVLETAREKNIKLMIEPKFHGHEKNFMENLVKLLERYDMIGDSYIHSFDLGFLQNIKKMNPHIKIGLLIFGGFGSFGPTKVDFFSIQETVATRAIIDNIHKYDKKVFLWTINSSENLDKYIKMGVDGFITDEIELIKTESEKIMKENKKPGNFHFKVFGIEYHIYDWIDFLRKMKNQIKSYV